MLFEYISKLIDSIVENLKEQVSKTSMPGSSQFNQATAEIPRHQLVLLTAALYFVYNQSKNPWIFRYWRARHNKSTKQRLLDFGYGLVKYIPYVKNYVQKELDKNLAATREKLSKDRAPMTLRDEIPLEGLSTVEILKEFGIDPKICRYPFQKIAAEVLHDDHRFTLKKGIGKDSGAVYAARSRELTELLKEVYGKTELTNPMHAKWPRLTAMTAEVIRWTQKLFHGAPDGYGLITHGGTSSIIEAMSAYVADARKKGVEKPEIVVPSTAHAAFHKAAKITGATLINVPVDPETGAVQASEMAKYISRNTAVIVGSAPSFMFGVADPIEALGELAASKKVPLHVDACLGGFLTAFMDTSDAMLDFRVHGVTSISADFHKYGYGPKGSSFLLFSKDAPVLSVYAALNWQGGLYATAGVLDGSTSGARVAEIYTTMAYIGFKGYQKIVDNIIRCRDKIKYTVDGTLEVSPYHKQLFELEIFGAASYSVLGFKAARDSKGKPLFNVHLVAEQMQNRGWKLNYLQNPHGFHICLAQVHTLVENFADEFCKDLSESLSAVKQLPDSYKPSGNVKVYGTINTMPTEVQEAVCVGYQEELLKYNQDRIKRVTFFDDMNHSADAAAKDATEKLTADAAAKDTTEKLKFS